MPLDGARLRALREIKGFRSQQAFADAIGVPQSHICDLENGKLRNQEVFVRIADELDCTTDFLFGRGPFRNAEEPTGFRNAISRMAFDVFVERLDVTIIQIERCARVLDHPDAPITARSWKALAEMIDRAIGPTTPKIGLARA